MKVKKVILVTGGSGFIGSALIRHMLKSTDNIVVNLDKLTYAGCIDNLTEVDNYPNYHFEHHDICDRAAVNRILQQYKPDAIMHLAAESHVDNSIESPAEFIQTNIVGTYTLLESVRKYWERLAEEKKVDFIFHHISTDEVYGDLTECEAPFKESTPYSPSSPYSASKASADHLVRAWYRTYGLPIVITNCSNNYGPFQYAEKLIPLTISNALQGKVIPIYGDGKQIRDWLYVDDHVKALLAVMSNGETGNTYNIGGNQELTNIVVVKTICAILDELRPVKTLHFSCYSDLIESVSDRPGHDYRYAINNNKICSELCWKPEESFQTGIKKTVEWYFKKFCNKNNLRDNT